MIDAPLTRRMLLSWGAKFGLAATLPIQLPAIAREAATLREQGVFSVLTPGLAGTLEAVAARIFPLTDTPGARELGAIWFMDAALGSEMSGMLGPLMAGAEEIDQRAGGDFSGLSVDRQDALLREIENGPFFGMVHFLTMAGVYAMPSHGGNQNEAGWDALGYERGHYWQPPFGYYDRDAYGSTEPAREVER